MLVPVPLCPYQIMEVPPQTPAGNAPTPLATPFLVTSVSGASLAGPGILLPVACPEDFSHTCHVTHTGLSITLKPAPLCYLVSVSPTAGHVSLRGTEGSKGVTKSQKGTLASLLTSHLPTLPPTEQQKELTVTSLLAIPPLLSTIPPWPSGLSPSAPSPWTAPQTLSQLWQNPVVLVIMSSSCRRYQAYLKACWTGARQSDTSQKPSQLPGHLFSARPTN